MPGRDGTGPEGKGPMTGRKAGNCGRHGQGRSPKGNSGTNRNVSSKVMGFFQRNSGNNNKQK